MRKMHFAMRAAALAVFPGGFGTFDELFELMTLVQTGKMKRIPLVCFGREYWSKAINLTMMIEEGFIEAEEAALLTFVDSAEEGWASLVSQGLTVPPARRATPRKDVAP
jgi:predicted Rossmann-fold nucleotide-binding protein